MLHEGAGAAVGFGLSPGLVVIKRRLRRVYKSGQQPAPSGKLWVGMIGCPIVFRYYTTWGKATRRKQLVQTIPCLDLTFFFGGARMEDETNLLIVGAGPFGLSLAAYADDLGIAHLIAGK